MLFWIAAAGLMLATLVAVLSPLLRSAKALAADSSYDAEVYRDQLAELDRERERGAIGDAEAESARAEIARRLIASSDAAASSAASAASAASRLRLAAVALVALLPVGAVALYLGLGSPGSPAMPLEARLDVPADNGEFAQLVARAERHLADKPDDGRGWDVLAPIYLRLGRPFDSVTAYRNAIRLLGESADRQAGLGEAIFVAQNGIVTKESAEAFDRALELDVDHAKAMFFRGLASAQAGDESAARTAWTRLAARTDTEWAGAATSALQELDGSAVAQQPAAPATGGAAPQIDAETMAAAGDMNAADQQQMIAGMVERLDQRLRSNPDDSEGWKRLIRAYSVMGDRTKAGDALDRALAAFAEGTDARADILAFAEQLGIRPDGNSTQ